jgi:hypothetical protein
MKNTARWTGTWGLVLVVATMGCGQPPDDPGNEDVTIAEAALRHETHGHHDRGPRLRSPLSATISTSRRPLFRWFGSHDDSVRVEVCRDRDCDHRIVAFEARGSHARPPRALPAGPVFWRVLQSEHHHGASSQVWELVIPARESGRPDSWGAIPDFNGDGISDLEVTALGVGAPPPASEVRIFPGGPGGPAATPAQTFAGAEIGFGFTSGPVGDLNGDGFCDLAVWTGLTTANTVSVFFGGPGGVTAPVVFSTPTVTPGAQALVVPAGDVNSDGYGDMLVGGDAYAQLFLGGPDGVSTTAAQNLSSLGSDSHRVVGGADFNGDGFPDAFVASDSGQSQIFYGDGDTLVPSGAFVSGSPGLAGDVNADGFADVADYTVTLGSPTGPGATFQAVAGTFARITAGDTNHDGYSDVLTSVSSVVGVPEPLRVYFGGPVGCTTNDCPRYAPILSVSTNVYGAAGVGDVNADGFDDVALFVPADGAVHLFYGSPAGPPATPSRTITSAPGFGYSVGHL